MLVPTDNEHIFIYICVDGRHQALGLADFVALAGGPFGPGGIDLSCRLDPPPRLALVLLGLRVRSGSLPSLPSLHSGAFIELTRRAFTCCFSKML